MGERVVMLRRNDSGRLLLDVDGVTYAVEPLAMLDENLRTCLAEHRDALLDHRPTVAALLAGPQQAGYVREAVAHTRQDQPHRYPASSDSDQEAGR